MKQKNTEPERVVGLEVPLCAGCGKAIQTAYNMGPGTEETGRRYHRDVPECQAVRLERMGQRAPATANAPAPVAIPIPDPVDQLVEAVAVAHQVPVDILLGKGPAEVAEELDRIAAEGVPAHLEELEKAVADQPRLPSCPACYVPHVDGPRACYSSDQAQRIRARGESGKRDWDWIPSGPREVKDSAIQRRRATRTDLEADTEQLMDYPMPWREKPLVDTRGDWRKWAPPPQELGTPSLPPRPPVKVVPLEVAVALIRWWKPGGPEHDGWVASLIRDLEKISLDRR